MTTHDTLTETYDAWKRATDEHQDMMASVMSGGLLDVRAMMQKTQQIDALHATWMKIAQQLVCTRTEVRA
ncbi:hypothetical protein [Variovorax sp. dw_308]|uniref:hypothetical protein n=1 Tax=Variovorax sp. dw_308 TaxID=2721546 RepID=UPI001C45410B|nr:hypothetical protein [Variovorax sp. dw_308]